MKRFSRRSFLAGSAAAAAAPALSGRAQAADVDVLIIGAGAAGIAAARKLVAAGRSVLIVEASDRVGGRCITDRRQFAVPYDLGAHWLHMPDLNPLARLAPRSGMEVYPAPAGQKLRIGRRNAREGEMEDFLANLVRSNRAIQQSGRGKTDMACSQALPKDLGDWKATVDFVLGPFGCAKELERISAFDFAKSLERDVDSFCRQGLGALLAKLAEGLPVRLSSPVRMIDLRALVEADTPEGRVGGRVMIVTASTNVLLSGQIKFIPDWPKRHLDALNALRLGSYERIALELPGNPLGLQRDDLVFEKAENKRTAALLANVNGGPLSFIDVAGDHARDLSAQGRQAMIAFAGDWLANLFGTDIKKAIKRSHATAWHAEPYALGAFSAAAVHGQGARRILMEPIRDRIFLAGEAAHETLWGTVGGAWESGERAADAVMRKMGWLKEPEPPKRQQQPAPKSKRR